MQLLTKKKTDLLYISHFTFALVLSINFKYSPLSTNKQLECYTNLKSISTINNTYSNQKLKIQRLVMTRNLVYVYTIFTINNILSKYHLDNVNLQSTLYNLYQVKTRALRGINIIYINYCIYYMFITYYEIINIYRIIKKSLSTNYIFKFMQTYK